MSMDASAGVNRENWSEGVHMFEPASAVSQPASVAYVLLALSPAGAIQGGVAVRQAPEPGPV
jgi:hypothetical protein